MRAAAAPIRFLRGRSDAALATRADGSPLARAADAARRRPERIWPVLVGCLVVAAFTLLYPSTPTYDPWGWIMWGREIVHLDLNTRGGPSWKPLPILFTVPFSLFGQAVAPYLWLLIARAGGLLACAMCFRLARRFAGGVWGYLGGAIAALALISSFKFVRDAALGNSEALLAGLALWAFERHLDGRRDHALYLGVGAALLRPEVWPFLGLYGLYLWAVEPRLRLRMIGFAVLIPALWFLPEWWGSGDPFRASARASAPNPGSAGLADHPALELLKRFRKTVVAPIKVGAIVGFGYAAYAWWKHRREKELLALAIGGAAWFALVAAMTQAGYAGNQRYLIISTACACVLGGVGIARVFQGIAHLGEQRLGTPAKGFAVAVGVLVVGLGASAGIIHKKIRNAPRILGGLKYEARLWSELKTVIHRAGGPARLRACGAIASGPFQIEMLAYELRVHGIQISWRDTFAPGVAFRTRTVPTGPQVVAPTDLRFRRVARYGKWQVLTVPPRSSTAGARCPSAGPLAPTAVPGAPQPPSDRTTASGPPGT